MTLEPFVIEGFGGLDLASDPQEMGATGATGVADIDYDKRGRIRTRNGFTSVKTLTLTSMDGLATFENTAGLKQLVVAYQNGATKKYDAYSSSGGAAVATATPTNTRLNAVRFGTLANEYLYIGNGLDTVWRWDGAAFTQPAGMPTALFLAVSVNSNRLVAAHTDNGSKVQFSDPGAPETFGADNFVVLTPGDGTKIGGLASWQDYVFAFKQRRFFVFTGESVDADGGPIFNYRTVDGYGALVPPAAGDEGVYFFDGRSVWVTTGGVPARVSLPIEASLRGEVALTGIASSTVDPASLSLAVLSYSLGRLYLSVKINSGSRVVFVYDPKIDKWTIYVLDLSYFATLRRASADKEYTFALGNVTLTPGVYYQDPTAYEDFWDGGVGGTTVIHWYYITGFYAVGPPERVAVIGETCVVGAILDAGSIPNVNVSVTTDVATNSGSASLAGSANGLGDREAWVMADCEGRRWQLQLQGSGGFVVSRVTHYVSFIKPTGVG